MRVGFFIMVATLMVMVFCLGLGFGRIVENCKTEPKTSKQDTDCYEVVKCKFLHYEGDTLVVQNWLIERK